MVVVHDDDDSKLDADGDGFWEKGLYFFCASCCCDVDVIGCMIHERVAYIAASKIGCVAILSEFLNNFERCFSVIYCHIFSITVSV